MLAMLLFYLRFCMYMKRNLPLREEHVFRMFTNEVLGRVFGPKRQEVATRT